MADTPYVLLPPGADLRGRAAELVRQGWTTRDGFALPEDPWWLGAARMVAVGSVRSEDAAQAALDCAVRGLGLVVDLDPDAAWAVTFRSNLDRATGAPEPLPDTGPEPAGTALPLSSEQREVLDLLAAGHSIAQAARLRFLSLRTANRRVREARETLGVATNREAVVAYVRLRDGS
jgi:DNA-binding NarL/FixJ family response regulator